MAIRLPSVQVVAVVSRENTPRTRGNANKEQTEEALGTCNYVYRIIVSAPSVYQPEGCSVSIDCILYYYLNHGSCALAGSLRRCMHECSCARLLLIGEEYLSIVY